MTRPNLRIIDSSTGEVQRDCPNCQLMADDIAGLERENRAWRARYAELSREREEDIEADPLYNDALIVFKEWKAKCNHPRSKFDAARFKLIRAFLRDHGVEMCRRAVAGAAYDPYVSKRRNGTSKRHDGWELIFRDKGRFEEFVNRAPLDE